MNVLFWDVDQTLVLTGHAGFLAIVRTLEELAGPEVALPNFDAGGRTDNFICRAILQHVYGKEPTMDEIQRFSRHYEEVLLEAMQETNGEVLPNVLEILTFFSGMPNYDQMLLTGNSRHGAELKLGHFGLAMYFDFDHSGFAEDSFDRSDVAKRAVRLAREKWGDQLERVFIIGDTEHDINCGKAVGAYTVAVATGTRSYVTLASYDPWRVMQELPPAEDFYQMVLEE